MEQLMKNSYTATYEPDRILGEDGYSYTCYCNGVVVFEGWTRGKKRDAEAEVRNGIMNREALLGVTVDKAVA
jgi:hypothetical protein